LLPCIGPWEMDNQTMTNEILQAIMQQFGNVLI
jgi:hypothetical protein